MPHVSVIIPAYNAERYIAETVQSALDQTWRDLEIIVVDDGSKDGTLERLQPFGSRIRVHQQANAGVSRARNAGARLATGEWVAFLDADDLWLPQKVERQLACTGVPMTFTNRYNFGVLDGLPELHSLVQPMRGGDLFVPLLREGNFITSATVMLRRELFEQLGGFYTGLNGTEDWDLWIRVAENHPISFVEEPLVRYRLHGAGISRNYERMSRDRTEVISRALALPRGRALDWTTRRQIWAETWRTNGWDAGRAGAKLVALTDYARAAAAWPLSLLPYKEALKVCLNV